MKIDSSNFRIPVRVAERYGLGRKAESIRIGVPVPRGLIRDTASLAVCDEVGALVPHQAVALTRWGDRSARWVLVDAGVRLEPGEQVTLYIQPRSSVVDAAAADSRLRINEHDDLIEVETGTAAFVVPKRGSALVAQVMLEGERMLADPGMVLRLCGPDDVAYEAKPEELTVEASGPFRATLAGRGQFKSAAGALSLRFSYRIDFFAGSSRVCFDIQVWNPRAAAHAGGLWDLGDPGSSYFRDVSLNLRPRGAVDGLHWYEDPAADGCDLANEPWSLYQDSSGGAQWDSPNHLDRHGRLTVKFRGYRVSRGSPGREVEIATGERANPGLTVTGGWGWIAVGTRHFWQNFPKALRWHDDGISIGLFPREASSGFELQGGERKRHTVFVDFGRSGDVPGIAEMQCPAAVSVGPDWIETSGAIGWFVSAANDCNQNYLDYIEGVVSGPRSFFARREIIDEYGWRNFGDLYADHEAVNHRGEKPFISHYNNQYDFIYGAFLNFERTGDDRWRQLMSDAAHHMLDIDIYHTEEDRPAYSGGLFWHTDHYRDARTSTHRTFSRSNGEGRSYGGGPSNEHNYTSGLLSYYFLTGDGEARDGVLTLADWVLRMDDGTSTIFSLLDARPTGLASRTVSDDYHKPGRGAGNSINALLDAYVLSRRREYMFKAEELVRRCVHPRDDIERLRLDEPEYRWSYLVFLQVLGKYLDVKLEIDEIDYSFYYARDSLLHYADWMLEHEVPYKDVLHKVEYPTETWPAHDIRKCHVFHLAARCSRGDRRSAFAERARFFFERCMHDVLSFETSDLTRPYVLLSVYGSVHGFFLRYGYGPESESRYTSVHGHCFGEPEVFVPQRGNVRQALRGRMILARRELERLFLDRWTSVMRRLSSRFNRR